MSGQGDVLLQILLRQVVPRVVAEGPAQEFRQGIAGVSPVAGGEDGRNQTLANPLVQDRRGYAQDRRSIVGDVGAANVQLRRRMVSRGTAYR